MENISVIVPVFHGRKYIETMIAQLELCANIGYDKYKLELVLVNDDPRERIGSFLSEKIKVKILETDKNRGIHGARVRGMEHCTGDYILFLDQDDRIQPTYFSSQLACLGGGDAVVCKLLHEGRQFYDTRMPFEQVVTRDFIISVRNPIISPGQVVIKRNKMPETWTTAVLKNNGADDWLLWLCMLGAGVCFALNPEILFEHVVAGHNESMNVAHMIASEQEIYEVVSRERILTGEELQSLQNAVNAAADEHLKLVSKFQKMFFIYDEWLKLQELGIYVHEYLKDLGINSVAIYGDSYIGKRIYYSLKGNGVEVRYFIDRNAEYLEEEIPVYRPRAGLPAVDAVIISLVEAVEAIRAELIRLSETKIYSLTELFAGMKNDRHGSIKPTF